MAEEVAVLVAKRTVGAEVGERRIGRSLIGRGAGANVNHTPVIVALLDLDEHRHDRVLGSRAGEGHGVGIVEELDHRQVTLRALDPVGAQDVAAAQLGPGQDGAVGGKEVPAHEDGADVYPGPQLDLPGDVDLVAVAHDLRFHLCVAIAIIAECPRNAVLVALDEGRLVGRPERRA